MWLLVALLCASLADAKCPNVQVFAPFVPSKYLGQWYEIGASPLVKSTFERDCACTNANYGLFGPGNVSVTNKCSKGGSAGPISTIKVRPLSSAALCLLFPPGIRHARDGRCVPFFFFSVFWLGLLTSAAPADSAKLRGESYQPCLGSQN
jgi:hypothetical protein